MKYTEVISLRFLQRITAFATDDSSGLLHSGNKTTTARSKVKHALNFGIKQYTMETCVTGGIAFETKLKSMV
jgi:hypothetical protein